MRIVEYIPEHYEVKDVEDFGRVYKWRPEQVVVECGGCGNKATFRKAQLLTSVITCDECGERSTAGIRERLIMERLVEDDVTHPWRYWHAKEGAEIPA